MGQSSCPWFRGLLSQSHGVVRGLRCSFRSPQNLSCCHSLVYGSLLRNVRPSVRPARGCISPSPSVCVHLPFPCPSVCVHLPFPSGGQQLLARLECVFGEVLPFSERGSCSRSRAGAAGFVSTSRGCSSQEPSTPPSTPRALSSQAFWHFGARVVLAVSISCPKMCFHIYMSRGWARWRPLNPTSVYSVN